MIDIQFKWCHCSVMTDSYSQWQSNYFAAECDCRFSYRWTETGDLSRINKITIFLDPVSSADKIARKGFYKSNEETDSEEIQTPTNTLPELNEVDYHG